MEFEMLAGWLLKLMPALDALFVIRLVASLHQPKSNPEVEPIDWDAAKDGHTDLMNRGVSFECLRWFCEHQVIAEGTPTSAVVARIIVKQTAAQRVSMAELLSSERGTNGRKFVGKVAIFVR